MRFCNKQSGFTLIELIVIIAILGVFAGIAVPNFLSYMPKYRLNGAARQIMGDLMAARMQAVKENRKVGVGWVDETNYGIFRITPVDPGADIWTIIKPVNIDSNYPGVTLGHATVSGGFIGGEFNGISFSSRGTRDTGGSIGLINSTGSKRVTVSITGRVKITDL